MGTDYENMRKKAPIWVYSAPDITPLGLSPRYELTAIFVSKEDAEGFVNSQKNKDTLFQIVDYQEYPKISGDNPFQMDFSSI